MISDDEIDAMGYDALVKQSSMLRGLIERSYADTVGMDHAESEAYVQNTVGGVRSLLKRIDQRLLRIAAPQAVSTKDYTTAVHCPKCFRGVAASISVDELWLFGATTEARTIVNLYCRQCKGVRWRRPH